VRNAPVPFRPLPSPDLLEKPVGEAIFLDQNFTRISRGGAVTRRKTGRGEKYFSTSDIRKALPFKHLRASGRRSKKNP